MRPRTILPLLLAAVGATSTPGSAQIYVTRFDDAAGWTFEQCGCGPRFAVDATPPFLGPRDECPSAGDVPSFFSSPFSLNFNNGSDIADVLKKDGTWGRATSPPMDISGAWSPVASFWSAWCHEPGCDYDIRTLEVSNDGFQTLLLALCLDETAGPAGEWEQIQVPLEPAWGTIQLRFRFSTIDPWYNYGSGWFVDDLFVADCAPPPEVYCTAAPNSVSGAGASIAYVGSIDLADDSVVLEATGLPPGQLTLFLYGPSQAAFPAGNGFFCLGSPFYRLYPASPANGAGIAAKLVDVSSPPTPAAQVLPGSTWNFQNWYRDPAGGGALFNFSDGVQVTFCR